MTKFMGSIFFVGLLSLVVAASSDDSQDAPDDPDEISQAQFSLSPRLLKYRGLHSKLPWMTGLANVDREHECIINEQMNQDFLNRQSDLFAGFFPHSSIEGANNRMAQKKANWLCFSKNGIVLSQVMPILNDQDIKNADEIIDRSSTLSKKYQDFFKNFAETLKATGHPTPFLRLGHEMNLAGGYPWAVPNNISASQFVALFRLAVDSVRPVLPGARIVWNPGKYSAKEKTDAMYPGDQYVDIIGVDWYDNGGGGVPVMNQQSDWDRGLMLTGPNGPRGLGAWLSYAKKHHKPLALPEWALKDGKGDPNRTTYVKNLFAYFKVNMRHVAYESYYNEPNTHQIYPKPQFPASAKLYPQLW